LSTSSEWIQFVDEIEARLLALRASHCPDPWFRGQGESSWKLLPTLGRLGQTDHFYRVKEQRLFWDFRMLGSHLLPQQTSNWGILCQMQHHGIPTRLLDWTNSFSTALFFALSTGASTPTVWILNPYELNRMFGKDPAVSNLSVSSKMDYIDFVNASTKPAGAYAVAGDAILERVRAQGGSFSLHGDLNTPLEDVAGGCLSKHVLPDAAIADACRFLRLAGTNEFGIRPDLDGLSAFLCRREGVEPIGKFPDNVGLRAV
jgi:FRG domain